MKMNEDTNAATDGKQEVPAVKWEDFIPWLRRQPRERKFDYINNKRCLICSFLRETQGLINPNVGPARWSENHGPYNRIPDEIADAVVKFPRTCGNVLDHLTKEKQ